MGNNLILIKLYYCFHFFCRLISQVLLYLFFPSPFIKNSLNIFGSFYIGSHLKEDNCIHHLHWVGNDTISIFQLKHLANKKVIITLHDEWFYRATSHAEISLPSPFYSNLLSNFIFRIKYQWLKAHPNLTLICPSNFIKDRINKLKIIDESRLFIVPNYIDLPITQKSFDYFIDKYKESKKVFRVCINVYPNSNHAAKGASIVSNIIEDLLKFNENVEIVCFGSDKDPFYGVTNLGKINNPDELSKVIDSIHLSINPTLFESFGQLALEFMLNGVPVICFNETSLAEFECSIKCRYGSHEELLREVKKFIKLTTKEKSIISYGTFNYAVKINNKELIIDKLKEIYSYTDRSVDSSN